MSKKNNIQKPWRKVKISGQVDQMPVKAKKLLHFVYHERKPTK